MRAYAYEMELELAGSVELIQEGAWKRASRVHSLSSIHCIVTLE